MPLIPCWQTTLRAGCSLWAVLAIVGLWVAEIQAQGTASLPVSLSSTSPVSRPGDVGSFEIRLKPLENATSAPVVTALAASAEGRFLAVAGDDHAIRVIDVGSGQELGTFAGHIDWIQSLAFGYSPQAVQAVAPILYSAGNDGRVLEWKYAYPVASREVIRLPYAVRSISVSSGMHALAIAGFSNEVLVWDLQANQLSHRLLCEGGDQRVVRFSPDGKLLLSAGRNGEVRVWDSQTGERLAEYQMHRGRVTTAAFSVDGSSVTSAGEDRRLVRYDIVNAKVEWQRELGKSKIMSLCLINDNLVAVAGADNKVRLFDALTDSVVAELEGHWGTVAVMEACGSFLASGSFDTTVRIWDLEKIDRSNAAGKPVMLSPLKMDADLRIR